MAFKKTRDTGANPRATGTNPRATGHNERAQPGNPWARRNWKRKQRALKAALQAQPGASEQIAVPGPPTTS